MYKQVQRVRAAISEYAWPILLQRDARATVDFIVCRLPLFLKPFALSLYIYPALVPKVLTLTRKGGHKTEESLLIEYLLATYILRLPANVVRP